MFGDTFSIASSLPVFSAFLNSSILFSLYRYIPSYIISYIIPYTIPFIIPIIERVEKALLKYYPFEYKALLQSLTQLEEASDENNEHLL